MGRILILEDDIDIIETYKANFADDGHVVEYETDPARVMDKIEAFHPQLITLDIRFGAQGDATGIALLEAIRARYPREHLPIIAISAEGDAERLQHMLDLGLNDFVCKPIEEYEFLLGRIRNLIQQSGAGHAERGVFVPRIVGKSKPIMNLLLEVHKAAQAQCDALILGETGTGKERVAETYRQHSPRRDKPFYVIDCTTIPKETFESEVFGYVQGAYTGAVQSVKKGKIEEAAGGIIFFDEIGELTEEQQKKLLRLIQERKYTRMGSNEIHAIDVVILAATHRDLDEGVESGWLRQDFYHRLQKCCVLRTPPLREHGEDLQMLVEHFIHEFSEIQDTPPVRVSAEAMARLRSYAWPGNVRQLENLVRKAAYAMPGGVLDAKDVDKLLATAPAATCAHGGEEAFKLDYGWSYAELKQALDHHTRCVERAYLRHHLERHRFRKVATAKAIGLTHHPQLYPILRRVGLHGDTYASDGGAEKNGGPGR